MSSRALAAFVTLGVIAGCGRDPAPDIIIDATPPCAALVAEVLDAPLFPGAETISLVGDGDNTDAGWAIVDLGARLELRRLGDDRAINLAAFHPQLIPGGAPGETWILEGEPGQLRLGRLDSEGLADTSALLDPFPESPPSAWDRAIVFIGRQPFLFASPRSSDSDNMVFWIAEIEPTLELGTAWMFEFKVDYVVNPDLCPNSAVIDAEFTRIRMLDVAEADGRSPATMMLDTQLDVDACDARLVNAMTLRVGLNPETRTPVAVLRTGFPNLSWEDSTDVNVRVAVGQLALAESGYYVLGRLQPPPSVDFGADYVLLFHDAILGESTYFSATSADRAAELIALDGFVGLALVNSQEPITDESDDKSESPAMVYPWRLFPLRGPSVDKTAAVSIDTALDVGTIHSAGGRGQVVVTEPNGTSLRIGLSCGTATEARASYDVPIAPLPDGDQTERELRAIGVRVDR